MESVNTRLELLRYWPLGCVTGKCLLDSELLAVWYRSLAGKIGGQRAKGGNTHGLQGCRVVF